MRDHTANKDWRMEANNPREPVKGWTTVFEFNDDQLLTFQELRIELDAVNKPIQLRIVHNPRRLNR